MHIKALSHFMMLDIPRNHGHRAALRLATLHTTHPLHKGIASVHRYLANKDLTKQKLLPTHKPFRDFNIKPKATETILPIRHYPNWPADVKVKIAESKEKALADDIGAREELRAYSDGSAVVGGVGGAAVVMVGGRIIRESRFYLGTVDEHTPHEGEVVGMILAVKLLEEEMRARGGRRTMSLGADNQAAIRSTHIFQSKPGHHDYLMDKFHNELRTLPPSEVYGKLIIRWSPGHFGIPGNEQADEQAKRAAKGDTSDPHLLPSSLRSPTNTPITLPVSKSAIKQSFRASISEEARTILRSSPRSNKFKETDPSFPSSRFAKLADEYSRKHAALTSYRPHSTEQTRSQNIESTLPDLPRLRRERGIGTSIPSIIPGVRTAKRNAEGRTRHSCEPPQRLPTERASKRSSSTLRAPNA